MKMIHHVVFLSPLLFVLGCATSGDDRQGSISRTDSLPAVDSPLAVRTVNSTDPPTTTPTEVGHVCNVLGSDGSTEGVHCANLAYVTNDTDTGWVIWPVGEALCQTVSDHVEKQCAGIRQNPGLFDSGAQINSLQRNCGRFGGAACPATTRFKMSGNHFALDFPSPGTCIDLWATMVNDAIVLPVSAKPLGPTPDVTSGDVEFCTP